MGRGGDVERKPIKPWHRKELAQAHAEAKGRGRSRSPITGRTLWSRDELVTIANAINTGLEIEIIQRLVPHRSPNAVAVKVCRMRRSPMIAAAPVTTKRRERVERFGSAREYAKAKEGSERLLRLVLRLQRKMAIEASDEIVVVGRAAE